MRVLKVMNNLLKYRLLLGYKKSKDFAEFLNIDPSNYSQIEGNHKQVELRTALAIAKKIKGKMKDVNMEDLFELIDED